MSQAVIGKLSVQKQLLLLWNMSHLNITAQVKFSLCLESQTFSVEQLQKMLLGGMTD